MKSMKSGMKGGSEVILLVIIPLLILIWFGVDESQKKGVFGITCVITPHDV